MGIPYDSPESEGIAAEVMEFVDRESKEESAHLASLRGPFARFEGSVYDIPGGRPLRNATTTTIAPTGTISIIASCSSGIEPVFALAYSRNVLDGKKLVEFHPLFRDTGERMGFLTDDVRESVAASQSIADIAAIPEEVRRVFRTAHDIEADWHIRIQAAFQRHTDNAVSKTINFPSGASVEDVANAYVMAFDAGLKGITIYRDGSREHQVLTAGKKSDRSDGQDRSHLKPRPRPPVTTGSTERF